MFGFLALLDLDLKFGGLALEFRDVASNVQNTGYLSGLVALRSHREVESQASRPIGGVDYAALGRAGLHGLAHHGPQGNDGVIVAENACGDASLAYQLADECFARQAAELGHDRIDIEVAPIAVDAGDHIAGILRDARVHLIQAVEKSNMREAFLVGQATEL